jgi:hypothetical protein
MATVDRCLATQQIMAVEKVSRALAHAETIPEIKEIRDKAEAVRKYAQSAALGLQAQNHAAEVKLRAERKAGSLLAKLNLRGGDRKSINQRDCLKLDDLGVSQNQSTRWQLQSRLPEDEFEDYIRTTREAGLEIASAVVLRLARQATLRRQVNGDNAAPAIVKMKQSCAQPDCHQNRRFNTGLDESLNELSHHRELLNQLLEPLYTNQSDADLLPAQRRVLGHILREMETLIHDMRRFSPNDSIDHFRGKQRFAN